MKNLRVVVAPTETGENELSQRSSYVQIMTAVEEGVAYMRTLDDYFQSQNDEELPIHFSFLVDIEKGELLC